MKVGFAGLSHLYINYAWATAAKGIEVVAWVVNEGDSEALSRGQFPIEEPGLAELHAEHGQRITPTTELEALKECELVFFALDIATDEANISDTSPLEALIDRVIPHIGEQATIVLLSQVNPGFTRSLCERLREQSLLKEQTFYYQVETLIFGRAVERATEPERYIIGCEDPTLELSESYASWLKAFDCPLLPMRYESAELAKIAINLFLVSTVTTTNLLAEVCEAIGADWGEIAPSLRLDRRIGPHAYLSPGLGISGGNLERDLVTVKRLSDEHHTDSQTIDAWQENSEHRKGWPARMLEALFASESEAPVIALWGLAYKQDTHSTKNSPALRFLSEIPEHYQVRAYDPVVKLRQRPPNLKQVGSPLEACEGAEALAILTPWAEFGEVERSAVAEALQGKLVLDPFGKLQAGEDGLERHILGRGC